MTTISLEDLTINTFLDQQNGKPFTVQLEEPHSVQLILESVTELKNYSGTQTRTPFSLLFKDRSPAAILPQQIYPLSHEDLGEMTIFLVPIAQDSTGVSYQAVFN